MSCPHVAGLAALCLSKNPFLYNYDVKDYITDGADDLGSAGKDDYYGYGRINAYGTINATPVIIYVDVDATGDDDGSSWTNAYNELQNAFDDASSGDQIFVAAGTYYPDEGDSVTDGTRSETFQLINGVTVRGAFAGYGESNPYYRNISTYTTTLSGDIDKDSVLDDDNSYHVVKGVDNATLEAFTITKGYADGDYSPDHDGGGMYNSAADPTVINCIFSGNSATHGGGMDNYLGSKPTVINCIFSGNLALRGGGMSNRLTSAPTVTGCIFSGNSAGLGGGLYSYDGSDPTVTNCLFGGNSANYGGGMYSRNGSTVITLTNCTFTANSANYGGAIRIDDSDVNMINCILWDDTATTSGNEIYGGDPNISYSDIEGCGGSGGGWDDDLGTDGGNNIDDDPDFDVDGYHLTSGSPCIDEGDPSGDYSGQVDIDGETREMGDEVDMGVDEYNPS